MKKAPVWLLAGCGAMLLLGCVGGFLGFLMPWSWQPSERAPVAGKSSFTDTKKKADMISQQLDEMVNRPAYPGTNALPHRVFVSRTLLFLPKEKESVQALNEELVTADGINVNWKIAHSFDPQDPRVAEQDEDRDGFSNKEEYDKKTDPNDPSSSPSKWVKIKISGVETNSLGVGLSGKSADRYTLRLQYLGKKKDVDVVIGDRLWLATSSKGVEILKSEPDGNKLKEGGCPHAIPVLIKEYHEDKGKRLDEKTKTENDYDDSYLLLQRTDGIAGTTKVLIDERGKSRGAVWHVGDVRLISLVPGEGEMGPYRVGQSFAYAGKNFVIREAIPSKVSLLMTPDGEEVQILPKTP
ncbi:hypothetical protein EBX31_01375 [bacterium]|nr:hypothetical protein [bacterium]